MNIALKTNQYSIHNTYLLEKKNNVIVEGTFSKILFSNQFFTMNDTSAYSHQVRIRINECTEGDSRANRLRTNRNQ